MLLADFHYWRVRYSGIHLHFVLSFLRRMCIFLICIHPAMTMVAIICPSRILRKSFQSLYQLDSGRTEAMRRGGLLMDRIRSTRRTKSPRHGQEGQGHGEESTTYTSDLWTIYSTLVKGYFALRAIETLGMTSMCLRWKVLVGHIYGMPGQKCPNLFLVAYFHFISLSINRFVYLSVVQWVIKPNTSINAPAHQYVTDVVM